jgi:16S rRNA (cytosine967-C5)-methyltransferase
LQILSNCSKYLKVGGWIIYATCTTCRNENQDVIEIFLAQNRNFNIIPRAEIRPERLQNLINHDNFLETNLIEGAQMDGFFAALMTRTS